MPDPVTQATAGKTQATTAKSKVNTSAKAQKKEAVPVGKKAEQTKTQKPETAMDRVEKVYKEKGFWAAAFAYMQEAFGGPPPSASQEEKDAYSQAQDLESAMWALSLGVGPF